MTTVDEPQVEHDLRCPELTHPLADGPDPDRCTCRDEQGHTPPTSWADGHLLAFDLETTAADPLEARLVTATVIDIRPRKKPIVTNWLSDVDGQPIPDEAAKIHGISTERAHAEGRPLADVVSEVAGALRFAWEYGVPVIGHNVSYDLTVMQRECARFGLPAFEVTGFVLDTIVLDRGADRFRKGKRTLSATCAHYGVQLTEADAHSSDGDALAAARVAWKISRAYPVIGQMPLPALMEWQAKAQRTWADGFGAYLRKQGKPDDVVRDWPVRGAQ